MAVTVFTNGCFDLLHPGHIELLERARSLGDRLVVGLNGDGSVRELKGPGRPILPAPARRRLLEALGCVDDVIVFDEPTPERLIAELRPDVLVKGSDWAEGEIVGADRVRAAGGRTMRVEVVDGWSTSAVIAKAREAPAHGEHAEAVSAHIALVEETMADCGREIAAAGALLVEAARTGATVFACGNGGSAAQAQHLVAELLGGTGGRHRAVAAQSLAADSAVLSALANDRGYEHVFADQVDRLAGRGDVLVALSAGGHSANVIRALEVAPERGCRTIALTAAGTPAAAAGQVAVGVPRADVARVQEVHDLVIHLWCDQLARECPP
jgi:D-glycero-beta-D-manno-heptose 1-phosphate adenylyltransferase